MMLQQELELIRIRSINNTNFIEDLIETYKSLSGMIKDNNRYFELNEEQLKLHKKFMDLTDDKVEKLEKVIGCCKDKTTFKHFHFCP
jgi:Leucine-rich repeat (LRR) protein